MGVVSYDEGLDMVTIEGDLMVPVPVYNYAKYIKAVSIPMPFVPPVFALMRQCLPSPLQQNIVSQCPDGAVEECFGTYDDSQYHDTGLDQTWRLWLFQVCTEWGYFSVRRGSDSAPSSPRLTDGVLSDCASEGSPSHRLSSPDARV